MRFSGVTFAWPGSSSPLVEGFSLDVPDGQITAMVGPSGCGKSTLLRLAAGLLAPTAGEVSEVPAARAFVFQTPNLLPWRSVAENVALPLQLQGVPAAERRARAAEALARVRLSEAADLLPKALSGGMRMRASLARALVTRPALLLMDEPFSALDALTRKRMHQEFLDLWAQTRATVLLVTHDLEEAALLADRIVALAGRPLRPADEVALALDRPRSPHDAALIATVERVEGWL